MPDSVKTVLSCHLILERIASFTTSSMAWQRAQSADWKFAVVMTKTALVKPSSSMNMHILNLSLFYVTFSFGINKNSFSSDFAHHQCPTNRFVCTQLPLAMHPARRSNEQATVDCLFVLRAKHPAPDSERFLRGECRFDRLVVKEN